MPKKEPIETTKATNLNEKFTKIGEQITKIAVDFTTLNVTTVTGDFTKYLTTGTGNNKKRTVNFSDFTEVLGADVTADATLSLVAHTRIDFDQDTVNFVKEKMSPSEENLFELHQVSIQSAQTARQSFLNFLKELV